VRHQTQARSGAELDPTLPGKGFERIGLPTDLHIHHIGLHRLNGVTRGTQAFGQQLGIGVVIGQARHLMIQRIQACSRQLPELDRLQAY